MPFAFDLIGSIVWSDPYWIRSVDSYKIPSKAMNTFVPNSKYGIHQWPESSWQTSSGGGCLNMVRFTGVDYFHKMI